MDCSINIYVYLFLFMLPFLTPSAHFYTHMIQSLLSFFDESETPRSPGTSVDGTRFRDGTGTLAEPAQGQNQGQAKHGSETDPGPGRAQLSHGSGPDWARLRDGTGPWAKPGSVEDQARAEHSSEVEPGPGPVPHLPSQQPPSTLSLFSFFVFLPNDDLSGFQNRRLRGLSVCVASGVV